jgi:hypothetical protein
MRLRSFALASLIAALPLAAAQADILAPGQRPIRCEVLLEGFERHPDLVFVVGPLGFRDDVAYVESGQAMPYQKFRPTRLYAIPRAKAVAADQLTLAWAQANAVAVSWHEFTQRHTVDEERPEHALRAVFRLGPCEGRRLVIEGVKEQRFGAKGELLGESVPALDESDPSEDRRGSWAPRPDDALLVLPAVAFVGLLGTWRRRRRAG